jgi:hypothetical protein
MDLLQENALGVKVPSGETILTKYLNGYTATVVVTGNEKAALNDTTPLAAGKTEVDNDTILNWTTGLDEIGSSYTIWAVKGGAQKNDTVVYSELTADNAYETFTEEADLYNGPTAIKMKTNGSTESFLNFGTEGYYTSDYRLEWTDANDSAKTVVRVAGEKITAADYADIQKVFNSADREIYVGTKKTNANYTDVSDEMSFRQFAAKYLTADASVAVTANENGNYVKVIDNDGDGVAEYVLKTEYDMDVIESISSKGEYKLSNVASIKGSDIVSEDELAAGDVIVTL